MTEEKTKELMTNKREFPSEIKQGNSFLMFKQMANILTMLTAGFFLAGAELPFSVYPLGCALVCALPKYGTCALMGIWLRCIYAAALGNDLLIYALCATVALLCRYFLCLWLYGKQKLIVLGRLPDTLSVRVLLGSVMISSFSLFKIILGNITAEKMTGMLFSAIACGIFSLLFSFFFEKEHRGTPAFEAGLGAAVFAVSLSLLPFSLGEFSFAMTGAFALTLYIGYLGSVTRSAAAGLLCGLAIGGYYAPVLALAGLVAGIFSEVHAFLSGVGAILISVCGILYFGGGDSVLEVLPECIFAAAGVTGAALMGFAKPLSAPVEEHELAKRKTAVHAFFRNHQEAERERRMTEIAHSMQNLASVMETLSKQSRTPDKTKLTSECAAILSSHCRSCPHSDACKGIGSESIVHISQTIASHFISKGKINHGLLSKILPGDCPKTEHLMRELDMIAGEMLEDAIRQDKTKVFAMDYSTMAQMFTDAAADGEHHIAENTKRSAMLRKYLSESGFPFETVSVYGDRKQYLILSGNNERIFETSFSSLQSLCSELCGIPFGKPYSVNEAGKELLILESMPAFSAETVCKSRCKKGETLCGDSFSHIETADGYYHAFLCDGMGSGEDAAMTSELCRIFLENMLNCGSKKATTLEMLNHFLSSRATECFATVDLVEVDLMQGIASFLKSGAVASYVIRRQTLHRIDSGTFPIGIMSEISAEVTEFELCDGDIILMCSDGVSEKEPEDGIDPVWLREFIIKNGTDDLEALAEAILIKAAAFSDHPDDMTAALIRIRKK